MKKIVVLGPESTGKSTLCEQLATHFKSSWVAEYARTYLKDTGNKYGYEDLWEIAKGQMELEKTTSYLPTTGHSPLFIDTDLYVIKIWSEISFNKCDHRVLTGIAKNHYDLYLLCNTDLPWTDDPLREYPELLKRKKIYAYYKDCMLNQQVPWIDISGNYEERLQKAIKAVQDIL